MKGQNAPALRAGARQESARRILERHGIRPSRLRGQSFLVQPGIAHRIARAAEISPDSSVIEIGPGLGMLTRALAPLCRQVMAVELDPRLARILREEGALPPHVEVMEADALKVDYPRLARQLPGRILIVANLPYAVSSPLLFRFLEAGPEIRRWVLMLQREVGERILAPPGSKEYGSLSVPLRLFTEVKRLFNVGASNFYPKPEVDSAVLRFEVRDAPEVPVDDPSLLHTVIRQAFGQRRKTLANALASLVRQSGPGPFVEAGVDPKARGETLPPEAFARLANAFSRAGAGSQRKTPPARVPGRPKSRRRG